jgi:membrane protease YdiL (CAAX protease family)
MSVISREPPARRVQLVEVLVFLLILLPSMVLPALGMRPDELRFVLVAGAVIAHNIALVSLVAYFVWRSGEGLRSVGWSATRPLREALVGAALFVPFFLAIGLLERLLRGAGLTAPSAPPDYLLPQGGTEQLIALVLITVVAVGEETIFRGYLIRRFDGVTGSRTTAVAVSTIIFALGHGYQGSLGIVAVALIGVLFALVYFWRGSLIAPMVMHFLQDFMGLLVAPHFAGGDAVIGL